MYPRQTKYPHLSLLMRMLLPSLLVAMLSFSCHSQEEESKKAASLRAKKQAESIGFAPKLEYLIKSAELNDRVSVDENGIAFYASATDKKNNKAEFSASLDEINLIRQLYARLSDVELDSFFLQKGTAPMSLEYQRIAQQETVGGFMYAPDSSLPLHGLRVALDPGHLGGDMPLAIAEDRYISMARASGDTLHFNEGNLNLATAYFLKDTLEALGAEVLLSRDQPGYTSFGMSFEEWMRDSLALAVERELAEKTFSVKLGQKLLRQPYDTVLVYHKLYKRLDFRERARKINAFRPDLTVVIHYNVDVDNWKKRSDDGIYIEGENNYSMVFVPGAFMRRELNDVRSKVAFLRLLVTHDLEHSLLFSNKVQQRFIHDLKVPAVSPESGLVYLTNGCIQTKYEGVYARNLSLTRLVHGALCYAEPLCQDFKDEAPRLALADETIHGLPLAPRVKETGLAYFHGIIDYLEENWE